MFPTTPYFGRIVFATSIKGTGDLGSWLESVGKPGLAAGDAMCRARASAAPVSLIHSDDVKEQSSRQAAAATN
jgi:hypothetical protein